MKKSIGLIMLLGSCFFSFSSFASRHCSDENTVMYAKTLAHTKEVEVCKIGERFRYTFGKTNSAPDIVLERTYSQIQVNDMRFLKSVEIHNGNITYDVGSYVNGDMVDDNNNPLGSWKYTILISKNNNIISEIKLDPGTMIDNTTMYATQD